MAQVQGGCSAENLHGHRWGTHLGGNSDEEIDQSGTIWILLKPGASTTRHKSSAEGTIRLCRVPVALGEKRPATERDPR